jgi:hypothetical protein
MVMDELMVTKSLVGVIHGIQIAMGMDCETVMRSDWMSIPVIRIAMAMDCRMVRRMKPALYPVTQIQMTTASRMEATWIHVTHPILL